MKRYCVILVLTMACVLFIPNVGRTETAKIKLAHALPVSHGINICMLHFKHRVEFDSSDSLRVEVVPEARMGSDDSLLEQVGAGVLPMAVIKAGPLSRSIPAIALSRLPFVFPDRRTLYTFLDTPFRKKLEGSGFNQRLIILAWFEIGPRVWISLKKPFTKPSDFFNTRVRIPDDPVFFETVSALGATARSGDFEGSALAQALDSGELDAADVPMDRAVITKGGKQQTFITLSRHLWDLSLLAANASFWNGLTPKEQQTMLDAAYEAERLNRGLTISQTMSALQHARREGISTVRLEETSRQAFVRAVYPVYEKCRDQVGPDLFDRFMNKVRESRPFPY